MMHNKHKILKLKRKPKIKPIDNKKSLVKLKGKHLITGETISYKKIIPKHKEEKYRKMMKGETLPF